MTKMVCLPRLLTRMPHRWDWTELTRPQDGQWLSQHRRAIRCRVEGEDRVQPPPGPAQWCPSPATGWEKEWVERQQRSQVSGTRELRPHLKGQSLAHGTKEPRGLLLPLPLPVGVVQPKWGGV